MSSNASEDSVLQVQRFTEAWPAALSLVLGQICGSTISCQVQTAAPEQVSQESISDLWLIATASGAL
jgi:hypothetical protein